MQKITIDHTKSIRHLEFTLPEHHGVYLLVGANGAGKTTLLVCLDRICNPNGFARGFSASRSFGAVDQYSEASIKYESDNPAMCLLFRKKSKRWAVSPKGESGLLSTFGFSTSVFIRADSNRISISDDEIRVGTFEPADTGIKQELNTLFETAKYNKLIRLRNSNGRGHPATYFYVIQEGQGKYYSEKRFSTGELALLRLVERLSAVEDNAMVLLDEAEMSLHPRIQKRLLDYLKHISEEKNLTVFISTHSVTMIKATNKNNILLLERRQSGQGQFVVTNPCYPAKAIGNVDFMDNIIYDAVFFVEDDMARLLLKKMLKVCCEADRRFITITNCIVPVGGYEQTAQLAINTKAQLLGSSYVCAVWDADVFLETIPRSERIRSLYEANRAMIFDLGCTPEVWMIEKLESMNEEIINALRERFHYEVDTVIHSDEYVSCNSSKPRKLAKQKMDVVITQFSASSGDSTEIVLDAFAQTIIDKAYTTQRIRSIVAPMLANLR
ncbi:AAA family ATPase [Clostridium sp. KNHs216]|uniref:ATP-dependent nuclease n=1 Tax=Clostridium sp. KNHs216 TaxID=1550235 RepID=UPI00114D9564|nr:AAA family ATPase [Clostridium sp. KNHs216]TQI66817.1 putative AbiEii toxin of type IV toxin-antitoxin system [Clostridium sp. KNHs216]